MQPTIWSLAKVTLTKNIPHVPSWVKEDLAQFTLATETGKILSYLLVTKLEFNSNFTDLYTHFYSFFRDHLPVAIKVINKNRVMQGKNEHVPIEVALMSMTSNIEGVIKLIEYFELPDCFMLVLERMMSTVNSNKEIKTSSSNVQDLFDFISDNGPLREELARKIFTQLIKTVNQITQAGVIHRDIKDENILIDTQTYQIKLIDFGSGAKLHDEIYTDFDGKCRKKLLILY